MNERTLGRIFSVLLNPVSMATLFGPLIMGQYLLYMRTRIVDDQSRMAVLLDDTLFRAILDYRTQLFTIILALVFYFYDNISSYVRLTKDHPMTEFLKTIGAHKMRSFNLLFVAGLFFSAVICSFNGTFADPSIVQHYIRPAGPLDIGMIPPLTSPLTAIRAFLFLAGFASSLAFYDTK